MPGQANDIHYFAFYGHVTGLILSNFVIDRFTKDGFVVDSTTSSTLALVEVGVGYYYIKYIPSSAGIYVLALSNVAHSINEVDIIEIEGADEAIELTQNTGGVDNLKPNITSKFYPDINYADFLLMIFDSVDWQVGRTDDDFAIGTSELDSLGNWVEDSIIVSPGTYHILIRDNIDTTFVIKPFFTVSV